MRYAIRPLTPEARARLKKHPQEWGSPFKATWTDTEELLGRELRHLGVRFEFVLMIDCDESDLRLDGALRANARPASPAVGVSLDSVKHGSMLFVCGKYPKWQHNVRAIALGLEALRKVERYGIVQSDEQYRGWQALPPGTAMGESKMTLDEAERVLRRHWHGMTSEHSDWDLLYKRGAKKLHPDVGGDPAEFRLLTEARDLLLGEQ